jgi:hypothetical protein
MSENRVDPTVAGLFLVGFITLFLGIVGIQAYNGSTFTFDTLDAALYFLGALSLVMLMFAYMAGKAGNAFATALFAFIAVSFFGAIAGTGLPETYGLICYICALFYLIFAIVAFVIGAPKLLAILLIIVALLFFFIGLYIGGGMAEDPYAIAFGIFGIVAFFVSTYLAFALATQKAPVF